MKSRSVLINRDKRGKYKKITAIGVCIFKLFPKCINRMFFYLFRNVGGFVGLGIRYVCFKNLARNCGDNVSIFPYCVLCNIENMSFGSNISIHSFCYLEGKGGVNIGDNVSIANHTSIISTTHTWNDYNIPIKYNPILNAAITISNDVWIACGVRIIGPCTIAERSIIAAGAVVKGEVLSNCIVGGIPAKKIKEI